MSAWYVFVFKTMVIMELFTRSLDFLTFISEFVDFWSLKS